MDFVNVKIEEALPVFLGMLGAMIFCTVISVAGSCPVSGAFVQAAGQADEFVLDDGPVFFSGESQAEQPDVIREMYQSSESQSRVIDFFTRICGSQDIAEAILRYANLYDVSPSLAFALAWEESRFNIKAVNVLNKDGSTDRGLFQLNNFSFPGIDIQAFFDPAVSARYGMSHLRFCLDSGGTEIAALAMYNAGTGRVRTTGAPKSTLDYVHRILENKQRLESLFIAQFAGQTNPQAAKGSPADTFSEKLAEAKPDKARFILLAPLAVGRDFAKLGGKSWRE